MQAAMASSDPQVKELFDELAIPPDACEECGDCLERCPAGIDIPARMREAIATFGAREP